MSTTGQRLLSLEDASRERLGGISVWFLRKCIAQGSIKPTRLGRRVFLSEEECTRLASEGLPSLRRTPQHEPAMAGA
jgi:hypothetical protein